MNENKTEIDELLLKISLSITEISNLLGCTFGPMGRNVAFTAKDRHIEVTRCGKAVLDQIEIDEETGKLVLSLVKQYAAQQFTALGLGVTSFTLLTGAMLQGAVKELVISAVDPYGLVTGLEKAMQNVDRTIKQLGFPMDQELIQKTATTACKDAKLGTLVAGLFGECEMPAIELSAGMDTSDETGTKRAISLPYRNLQADYPEARLLLWEEPICSVEELRSLLLESAESSIPLCIIAPFLSNEVARFIDQNRTGNGVNCIFITPPEDIPFHMWVRDIALLTGAKVLSSVGGFMLCDVKLFALVRVYNVRSLNGSFTIDFTNSAAASQIAERIGLLRVKSGETPGINQQKVLEKRIKLLRATIGFIHLGGKSAIELEERKRMVSRAIRAVEESLNYGMVPGGGVALLHCITFLVQSRNDLSASETAGFRVMVGALQEPFKRICINAGHEPEILMDKITADKEVGFDIRNFRTVDTHDMEALDPLNVWLYSCRNAVSLTSELIKTAHIIVS